MAEEFSTNEQSGERTTTDATGEFFSVGTPLHAVRAGYIRRAADDSLYETLVAGRYAHVIAPDRSGKSSLIAATAVRLESNGRKVAILDLGQLGERDGGTDSGRWYYSVAYRLLRQLRIRYDLQSWWQEKSVLSNRQRLVEFYSEILLQNVAESIVIFVDEVQCIENLDYADQLLASIRAAHNARATDPDFTRLTFVLSGECDPVSLIDEPELSPFNVTQQILLNDFSRQELDLFATELNLGEGDAAVALDRIFYWTNGQPYLSQKLARQVARETSENDIEKLVDRIATTQLAGRAALHSEPHMSHIHRMIAQDSKRCSSLLNLYGKIRKGIEVAADLGSPSQRRLMAVGLLVIDTEGNVAVRNRLYAAVFTARWANENLPTDFKVPAIVVAALLFIAMLPFWYTQWLPKPYVRLLASDEVTLPVADESYRNFRSFPGHADTADSLYRRFLERRAAAATTIDEIAELAVYAATLPSAGRLPEEFEAAYWDRQARAALRVEDRDTALLASLRSLVVATSNRRNQAAALVADDYPLLMETLPNLSQGSTIFDSGSMVLTTAIGPQIEQYSYSSQTIQKREPWTITALEVSPLVRRVIVDREGSVARIGLTLNVSHARLHDLRIKIIAPSGRTIEVETEVERASSADDIRIPAAQLQGLVGESLQGTWSISVRDERLGIAGQLVGWNLKLNSQGAVEYFQRGLNIPDPTERSTENLWFDRSGRYAIARAQQSDSARIWDLAFAEPVRAIALTESETIIGVGAGARFLVTATQDNINLWETSTGDKAATLPVGAASMSAVLTSDGRHLFAEHRGDTETRLELWNLEEGAIASSIKIAGLPAQIAIDANGRRVAIADFDRAVRVWDFSTTELLGQFDLPMQPSRIALSADGEALATAFSDSGLSLWSVNDANAPRLQRYGTGLWEFAFSPSGRLFAAGRPDVGYQVFESLSGSRLGPAFGLRRSASSGDLLAFSSDEQMLLTGSSTDNPRFWRIPTSSSGDTDLLSQDGHLIWTAAANRPLAVSPDGAAIAIGDSEGHVHIVPSDASRTDIDKLREDVSFFGHRDAVKLLSFSDDSSQVASIADDNSLRVWSVESGEPNAYELDVVGDSVRDMRFSPSGTSIAIISGSTVNVVSTESGEVQSRIEMGRQLNGLAFASDDKLYVGVDDGSLHVLSPTVDRMSWQPARLWQGDAPIRLLDISTKRGVLVLADARNRVRQFYLQDGRAGDEIMQLPAAVREIAFDSSGSRLYVRTSRWLHRASLSASGPVWTGASLVPPAVNGRKLLVNVPSATNPRRKTLLMPIAANDFVELTVADLAASGQTGLFGDRETLLTEWQDKISAVRPAESEPITPAAPQ